MKRSILTLFTGNTDIKSHIIRMVLAEKGVAYEVIIPDPDINIEGYQELVEINPLKIYPTVVDRSLVMFDVRIIIDYLDERFPHPSLYPTYPESRARFRMILKEIEAAIFPYVDGLLSQDINVVHNSINNILNLFDNIDDIIEDSTSYIMGEEFSILDCYIAPLIYRIIRINPTVRQRFSLKLQEYQKRIFERETFLTSTRIQNSKGFMADKEKEKKGKRDKKDY